MFGFGKKTPAGIYIGSTGAVILQVRKNGVAWNAYGAHTAHGPCNMQDPAAVKGFLSEALKASGLTSGAASVSLPDALSKAVIMEFEDFPLKKVEAGGIVRLRMGREAGITPSEHRIGFYVLGNGAPAGIARPTRVLAVAVKAEIVSACEEAMTSAGLEVKKIGIHSLNLANLLTIWTGAHGNAAVVARLEDSLTVMFFKDGVLNFYRVKRIDDNGGEVPALSTSFLSYKGKNADAPVEGVYLFTDRVGFEETVKVNVDAGAVSLSFREFFSFNGCAPPDSAYDAGALAAFSAAVL